jgi:hypothetical protein
MDINFRERNMVKKMVKEPDEKGKEKWVEVEVEETVDVPFETHPHELVGSIAKRYAKLKGAVPKSGVETLMLERMAPMGKINPTTPLRDVVKPIFDLEGTKRFLLTIW